MKTLFFIRPILILIIPVLLITSCKKDKDEKADDDTGSAVDNAFADAVFNDASSISDQAVLRSGTDNIVQMTPCATITFDTTSNPKVVTIDFGPVNCLCNDGHYRRGSIIVTYSGAYRDSGSTHTISFSNYHIDDYHVQGTKTVTNEGTNLAGNSWFSIVVNGNITEPVNGAFLTWQSSRTREWVAGESTLNMLDDIYHISGTASGTAFSGVNFTAGITDPLVVALNCRWIKDGILEFTPSGFQTRVIDYGHVNGNCDAIALVTIGSNSYVITLR